MILLNNQQSPQSQNWYSCSWGYSTWVKYILTAALSLTHLAHWPQSALPPITFSLLLLSQCTDSALILVPSFYLKHCNLPSPLMQFMVWLLLFSSNIIILFCVLLSSFSWSTPTSTRVLKNHCCLQSLLLSIISYDSPAACRSNNYLCDLLYRSYNLLLPVLISSGIATW